MLQHYVRAASPCRDAALPSLPAVAGRAAAELCAAPASALQAQPTLDIAQLDPEGGSPRLSAQQPPGSFGAGARPGASSGGGTPQSDQLPLGALLAVATQPDPRRPGGGGGQVPLQPDSQPSGGASVGRDFDAATGAGPGTASAATMQAGQACEAPLLGAASAAVARGALPPLACRTPARQAGHASGSGGSSNSPDAAGVEADDDPGHQSPPAPGSPPPLALGQQPQPQDYGRPPPTESSQSPHQRQPGRQLSPQNQQLGSQGRSSRLPAPPFRSDAGVVEAPPAGSLVAHASSRALPVAEMAVAPPDEALRRASSPAAAAAPAAVSAAAAGGPLPYCSAALGVRNGAVTAPLAQLPAPPQAAGAGECSAPRAPAALAASLASAAAPKPAAAASLGGAPAGAMRLAVPANAPLQFGGDLRLGNNLCGGDSTLQGLSPRASGSFTSSGLGAFKKYASPTRSGEDG